MTRWLCLLLLPLLVSCNDSGWRCEAGHSETRLEPMYYVDGFGNPQVMFIPQSAYRCDSWRCIKPEGCK